jgi:hypothetical protein
MSTLVTGPSGPDHGQTDTVFRRVMASITEQACASGRQGDVMEALFPLFLDGVGDHDGEGPVGDMPTWKGHG